MMISPLEASYASFVLTPASDVDDKSIVGFPQSVDLPLFFQKEDAGFEESGTGYLCSMLMGDGL